MYRNDSHTKIVLILPFVWPAWQFIAKNRNPIKHRHSVWEKVYEIALKCGPPCILRSWPMMRGRDHNWFLRNMCARVSVMMTFKEWSNRAGALLPTACDIPRSVVHDLLTDCEPYYFFSVAAALFFRVCIFELLWLLFLSIWCVRRCVRQP